MSEMIYGLSVIKAISTRRAVRHYKDTPIDREIVLSLLNAAVHAPTACKEEAWAFTVIEDRAVLKQLSDDCKKGSRRHLAEVPAEHRLHMQQQIDDPNFNVFYDAGLLVVIWAKPMGPFVAADCWMAAENLMLAALAEGLGSCVIGYALSGLEMPEWKVRLGVPADWTPVAPIIVGVPCGAVAAVPRKEPEIVYWK